MKVKKGNGEGRSYTLIAANGNLNTKIIKINFRHNFLPR